MRPSPRPLVRSRVGPRKAAKANGGPAFEGRPHVVAMVVPSAGRPSSATVAQDGYGPNREVPNASNVFPFAPENGRCPIRLARRSRANGLVRLPRQPMERRQRVIEQFYASLASPIA